MVLNKQTCRQCGGTDIKVGKMAGGAMVQALNSRLGSRDSELIVYFCASCGGVCRMVVVNPEAISVPELHQERKGT